MRPANMVSADELKQLMSRRGGRGGNKYGVAAPSKRRMGGRTYGSKAEMEYAQRLEIERAAGEVLLFLEQVKVRLGVPENVYVPDFFVITRGGFFHFVEVKGKATPKWRRDMKLWAAYGPATLVVVDAGTLEVTTKIPGGGAKASRRRS